MSILLILLVLLMILVLLHLFIKKEGFQDSDLDPNTVQTYNQFMSFYTPFCTNWEKAIQASVVSNIQQQPLTDPKQAQQPQQQAPQVTKEEMNNYIALTSQSLGQPLPQICVPLPQTIDSSSIRQVIELVPTDPTPYINALISMNTQLANSHSNLNSALQGGNQQSVEGFDECQDIANCIANDPQILRNLQQQMAAQNAESQTQVEQELLSYLNPFVTNQTLVQLMATNQQLMQKSQDIQNQAQSGQLYSQVNTPESQQPSQPLQKPQGADTLSQMKGQDPSQYNILQQTVPQFFEIKSLLEQINSVL